MLRLAGRRTDRLFQRYRETGDPRLLGVVFDRTAPELLKVALHLTRDPHRAEDALQSTFLTAIEKARQWDARRPLLPWLLAILANHARQVRRREKRPLPAPPHTGSTPGAVIDDVAARELEQTCDAALQRLKEPYRHVLILHLRHGLSGVEIARALDRSDSTVRNQIARGLDLLRSALPTGIVSGLAVVAAGGRGLPAVRAAVIEQAPRTALTGTAMAGTAWTLGVLLMTKKLAVPLCLVPLLLIGGIGYHFWSEPAASPPDVDPGLAAARQGLEPSRGQSPPPETHTTGSDEATRTRVDKQSETGTLRAMVTVEDTGAPAAGLTFEVWRFARERRGSPVAIGTTAPDGVALAQGLSAGGWFFDVRQGGKTHRSSFQVTAGEQTELQVGIPRGWDLEGIVVDRFGRPAPGAEVRALGEADSGYILARSGPDGAFAARHLTGDVEVWALAPGFQPAKRRHVSDRRGTAKVRLVLGERGTRLTGRVEDEQGRPVPRARIAIGIDKKAGSQFVQREMHDLVADADGGFAVDWLPPGRHFVGALPPDGDRARATARWIGSAVGSTAPVTLRLGDGGRLSGRIRDNAGQPVAGIQVIAWHTGESGLGCFDEAFGSTDDAGRYELRGLIAGEYKAMASRGAIRAETRFTVRRGESVSWNATLGEGAELTIRLLGPDGSPLPRWAIELRRPDDRLGWVQQGMAYTDHAGRSTFDELLFVEHQVRVLTEGFSVTVLQRDGVRPDHTELVLRLTEAEMPSARMRGRVVNARGTPQPDARVNMVQSGGGGSLVRTLEVGSDGAFATGLLPPGTYSLHATSPDDSYAGISNRYELVADQELDLGDLVLPDAARLVVRLAAEDGRPVRDAVLRLGTPHDVNPGAADLEPDEVDGLYRLEGIQPGTHELRFFAADAAPKTLPLELAPGQVRELDLLVERAVPVTLEIRCAVRKAGLAMLNGTVSVHDEAGNRIVFHRLWGYFDDFESRTERLRLALPPGSYRVAAEEFGGEETEVLLVVPAEGLAEPVAVDLR